MNDCNAVAMQPIGWVRNEVKEPKGRQWRSITSEIVIKPDLTQSVDGLEDFSHIIVVFWVHKASRNPRMKVHPQGRVDMPLTGVLATRSPHRPNPIGVKVVRLLERRHNVLKVIGLDAINGSPVLDIKPYLPGDSIPEAQHPEWVSRL